MKNKKVGINQVGAMVCASLVGAATPAYAAVDPSAAVVTLRSTCTENGTAMDNCFSDITALVNWITNTRTPGAADPLRVDIGPGTFVSRTVRPNGTVVHGFVEAISLSCDPATNFSGHISFVGSGPGQTILTSYSSSLAPVQVGYCTAMSFSDMTIVGANYGGVIWSGGGNSKWSNVEINAVARAWYENGCAATRGNHYWFGSKISATPAFSAVKGYHASCDESWFFGSEITAAIPAGQAATEAAAVAATEDGIVHVYGSVLRAFSDGTGEIPAALSTSGGEIHIHGTGIDVASTTGKAIVALSAATGGKIHANGAAYNMSAPGGSVARLKKDQDPLSHIHAPYLWEHVPDATSIPNYSSVAGADTTTLTSGTSDGHPHMAIYDPTCPSKWYDATDKACKP